MPTREFAGDAAIRFGPDVLRNAEHASALEWLVANGLGGYACGTVSGELTRRYHGLLVASLHPPVERCLLLVKLDETLVVGGTTIELGVNRWVSGAVAPQGNVLLESFRLERSVPCWTWSAAGVRLDKRVWMEPGDNRTWIAYRLLEAPASVRLAIDVIADARDVHAVTQLESDAANLRVERAGAGVTITRGELAWRLDAPDADIAVAPVVYRDYALARETERGFEDREHHLRAASVSRVMNPGDTLRVSASLVDAPAASAAPPGPAARSLVRRRAHESARLAEWRRAQPGLAEHAPAWIRQLVLAADAFVVERTLPDGQRGASVIAGYPWFTDWGRDTMIALPGLTLVTGRHGVAREILETFARYVDQGMLPNVFPDRGQPPEYHSVDAPLWWFQAVRAYVRHAGDEACLERLMPALEQTLAAFERGTRFGIGVDPADGLLRQGEPGVALTWMDARVDGVPVTPRTGKPVEINVLWHAALHTLAEFATRLGREGAPYAQRADRVRASFARFWNPAAGGLFDVLDGPHGDDVTLRPNQLFALSIEDSPLDCAHAAAVLDACERALVVPGGVRTRAPGTNGYVGHYLGDAATRDRAYHEGTAWSWLTPHVALARLAVHGDRERALAALEPLGALTGEYGLGSLPEVLDGDPPHTPRGCFAQAWSVAETLRAWHVIAGAPQPAAARAAAARPRGRGRV